jgi:hypothetical protein
MGSMCNSSTAAAAMRRSSRWSAARSNMPALNVAIQVYANAGADIRLFVVTGRLPLFGVVTSTKTASQIQSIKDLEGDGG